MQDVAPRAVRIADAMLATSCTIHLRVSFLVIVYLLPYTDYSMSPLPPVSPPVPYCSSSLIFYHHHSVGCTMSVEMTGVATFQEAFVRSIVMAGNTAASLQVTAVP